MLGAQALYLHRGRVSSGRHPLIQEIFQTCQVRVCLLERLMDLRLRVLFVCVVVYSDVVKPLRSKFENFKF